MCYISSVTERALRSLGLVEFEKCAILFLSSSILNTPLGLVEFEKCAIFEELTDVTEPALGLVEFEKYAILYVGLVDYPVGWGL